MFDISWGELGIIAIVALIVIAPNLIGARWS
jgi:Sec-independent protein translocase protein TatA